MDISLKDDLTLNHGKLRVDSYFYTELRKWSVLGFLEINDVINRIRISYDLSETKRPEDELSDDQMSSNKVSAIDS